jgi:hypothetical protein
MSKKKIKPKNEQPEGLDDFEQFVKDIFTMPPEEVKRILDEEKREGMPKDPNEGKQEKESS